jgi:para-nitrobenzyl esterase
MVTFNYRVGIPGYLAHPELSKEADYHASGNYGELDQVAALAWVPPANRQVPCRSTT